MASRIPAALRASFEVGREAVRSYGRDRVGRMAAALAYRTLFAVAPLLLLALGVFSLVIGDREEARATVVGALGVLLGPDATEAIESLVSSAVVASDATAIIGLALFAWASSSLFMDLQMSLADIFRVPREQMSGWRAFLRRRAVAIAWSLGFGLLFIVIWVANATAGWLVELIPETFELARGVVELGARVFALVLAPLVFMVMYRTMIRVPIRDGALLLGGVVTSVAFLATSYAAAIYFSWDRETPAGQIAGSVVVLLLLAYLLSSAVLMGAEVTRVYHERLQRK